MDNKIKTDNVVCTSENLNDKCGGCRFEIYDYSLHKYVCAVKGCYDNARYIEYKGIYDEKRKEWI